jgi:hypothetical protein
VTAELGTVDRRAAEAAVGTLYPSKGLHRSALAFATIHPRALQYLEQAPCMIVMDRGDFAYGTFAGSLRTRIRRACERGVALKEMLAFFGLPLPLRKLRPYALSPAARPALEALGRLDPVVLGRVIPAGAAAQRTWLARVGTWLARAAERGGNDGRPDDRAQALLVWACEHVLDAPARGPGSVPHVVDYALNGDGSFSTQWQWPRAVAEMALWHDRLHVADTLGRWRFQPTKRIDHGLHPDAVECAGLTFVALRTPAQILAEGAAMGHCVASYVDEVARGKCHIVAIRQGQRPLATLELSAKGRIVQVSGNGPRTGNATPGPETRAAAREYARLVRRGAELARKVAALGAARPDPARDPGARRTD